ncbi:hypothetical protein HYH03_000135 [Edaphochlamys debaryana]|uniref:Peroxisomal ATPase PEX1 n=1 Tax=Edaphochlamys debaryana TaxID=47281 RepID=A0A835YF10_9CHLO|nr:hypothetical protein HYH03_000135 [Edaphochlamys debaryana]|eukprot:KAG2501630.1 hypothetical protein HYH03_000135 [Edaphochlamys debaryana]
MEFVESMGGGRAASRTDTLTVTLISERTNWVSVPSALANKLYGLNELPVVLQLRVLDGAGRPCKQRPHPIHVAWTGDTLPASRVPGGPGGQQLGVPSALAAGLGLRADARVTVAPLLGVPAASWVEVEPEGEGDWEVAEANAGFLEDQMLGQVGVLSRGQALTVWGRGGAGVRLRVLGCAPTDLVRLVPGAEVRVAPKPRGAALAGLLGQAAAQAAAGAAAGAANVGGGAGAGGVGVSGQGLGPGLGHRPQMVPLANGPNGHGYYGVAGAWQGPPPPAANGQPPMPPGPHGPPPGFLGGAPGSGPAANGAAPPGLSHGPAPAPGSGPGSGGGGGGGGGAEGGMRRGGSLRREPSGGECGGGPGSRLLTPPAWAGGLYRSAPAGEVEEARPGPLPSLPGLGQAPSQPVEARRGAGPRPAAGNGGASGGRSSLEVGSTPSSSLAAVGVDGAPAAAGAATTMGSAPASGSVPAAAGPRPGAEARASTADVGAGHAATPAAADRPPLPLRLRVLDPPPSKYLVPLPLAPGAAPPPGSAGGGGGGPVSTAAAAPLAVQSWLTLAVAVAPSTAVTLLGTAGSAAAAAVGGTTLVRLHGRGAVRDLLGVLVPEPACPVGHVMLAPPLQHVLCVLPHMHVTITALPGCTTMTDSTAAQGPEADAAAAAALPSLTLHPLPVPAARLAAAAAAAQTPPGVAAPAAPPAAASVPAGTSEGLVPYQAALLAAATGSGRASSEPAAAAAADPAAASPSQALALSYAVQQWLAAQMEGIRQAVLQCTACTACDARDERQQCPDVRLPYASGAVLHFRIPPGCWLLPGIGSKTAAAAAAVGTDESAPPPAPGDYCLIAHAIRRSHAQAHASAAPATATAAPPPLVSAGMLTALAAAPAATSTATAAAPPLAIKLGQPVVLPAASYPTPRNGTAILPRPLPPPLRPLTPPAAGSRSERETQDPLDRSHTDQMKYLDRMDLDLDVSHLSWLAGPLEQSLRRLLPQLDPGVGAAVAAAGLPRCGGVLVTGPPGSGRSALLAALGDVAERHPALQAHVMALQCGRLAGGGVGACCSLLAAAAAEAQALAPCLLLLDDLDALAPAGADGPEYGMQHPDGAAAAARLADWLAALMDELAAAAAGAAAAAWPHSGPPPAVAVAACAKDAGAVAAALRRVGRLDVEVRLPAPGSAGRGAMMQAAARARGVRADPAALAAVAAAAEGFEGADLRLLLDRAIHTAMRRQLGNGGPAAAAAAGAGPGGGGGNGGGRGAELALTEADLRGALEGFVPAPFWGVQQASAAAGKAEGWEDVGGLEEVVAALREALLLPIRHRALVAAAPLRLRTGALLYGPPGCGKTHVVAAAVAAVSKVAPLRFFTVKGPELLNKYIGASEAAVRDLFARAAAAAPAVLFFDEFDAIAPPRGHDSTGVTDRVVNQLLTELDGVEGLRGVVVLGATSRPDMIDAALLRPGRLDRLLFCGPPRSRGQRLQILRALSRKLRLAPDVDLGAVAGASEGLTGADLGAVLSEAALHAINESVQGAEAAGAAEAEAGVAGLGGAEPGEAAAATRASLATAPDAAGVTPLPGTGAASAGSGEQSGSGGAGGSGATDSVAGADAPSAAAAASAGGGGSGPLICWRHVQRALAGARPSLPASEAARLEGLYARFRSDREASGARPGGTGAGGRATLA